MDVRNFYLKMVKFIKLQILVKMKKTKYCLIAISTLADNTSPTIFISIAIIHLV